MQIIKNSNGWSEVITTNIIVTRIALNYFKLDGWLEFNTKHPKIGKRRGKCKCCRKQFEDIGTDISLAVTNIGNEPICLLCANELITNGIDFFEKKIEE